MGKLIQKLTNKHLFIAGGIAAFTLALVIANISGANQAQSAVIADKDIMSLGVMRPIPVISDGGSNLLGIPMTKLVSISEGVRVAHDDGQPTFYTDSGNVELALYQGTAGDTNRVIAATVTNHSTKPVYITTFAIQGGVQAVDSKGEIVILQSLAVGSPLSLSKSTSTEDIILQPSESVTARIVGKWAVGTQEVNGFLAAINYTYDPNNGTQAYGITMPMQWIT